MTSPEGSSAFSLRGPSGRYRSPRDDEAPFATLLPSRSRDPRRVVGVADVQQPHERVVAAEVDRAGPARAFAAGVDVLGEVEPQELGDGVVAVGDGLPGDSQ